MKKTLLFIIGTVLIVSSLFSQPPGYSSATYNETTGHWYQYIGTGGTWSEANTNANALLNSDGWTSQLAAFPTAELQTFGRSLPGMGTWHIVWCEEYDANNAYLLAGSGHNYYDPNPKTGNYGGYIAEFIPPSSDPMVLVYNTNLADGTTITLPLYGIVDVTVNWGDETIETITSQGLHNHTYDSEGTYTVTISGSVSSRFGSSSNPNRDKLIKVESFGNLGYTSLSSAFYYETNLTDVPASLPSSVTDCGAMFFGAESINDPDIASWDVSNVTGMASMFYAADDFNVDVGSWDVSGVTSMYSMFRSTDFDQDISSWDISNVTDMFDFFYATPYSTENYDKLWNEWSKLTLQNNVTFRAFYVYYSCEGEAARQSIIDNFGWSITDEGLRETAPTLSKVSVTGIGSNSANVSGEISHLGYVCPSQVSAYGFCWNTSGSPTTSNNNIDLGLKSSTGSFSDVISGLSAGTTYYVRAFATNTIGTSYGEETSFTIAASSITWDGSESSAWATAENWTPASVPTSSDDVIIPNTARNPIISETPASPAQCNNITIESGAAFSINEGAALTVNSTLINVGTFTILSPQNNGPTGSLIVDGSITNTGSMNIQRWIGGGSTNVSDKTWYSIGIPTSDKMAGENFSGDYVYSYDYRTNQWVNIVGESETIEQGKGYIVKSISGNKTYNFNGDFNVGTYEYYIYNTTPYDQHGYHLVSNPYPSPINLELIYRYNVGNTFWVWDETAGNYISYQNGSGDLSRYILPCQAFFVKVNDVSSYGRIRFDNADRTHLNTSASFKSIENSSITLKVTDGSNADYLHVNERDFSNDGYKLFSMYPSSPQLYIKEDNKDYCIYNIPYVGESKIVSVGFKSTKNGKYTLESSKMYFPGYEVTLTDKETGKTTQLKKGTKVTFEHVASNNEDRFELIFKNAEVTDFDMSSESFVNIYPVSGNVAVACDVLSNVSVYSVSGQVVKEHIKVAGQALIPLQPGIYVIKAIQDGKVTTEKVIIR
ncbi:BspA family leucine-rich repeat surface protein [Bacteroidales bacterium]|nr:BspA family leucine-rich repeat surface protein [Bacteroidales bacterium]